MLTSCTFHREEYQTAIDTSRKCVQKVTRLVASYLFAKLQHVHDPIEIQLNCHVTFCRQVNCSIPPSPLSLVCSFFVCSSKLKLI